MIPLYEYEHQIYVDKDKELKKSTIQYVLLDAQKTRRYAKFICGRYYISVTFNRDYTIQIASNYRYNLIFNKELGRIEAIKYTLNSLTVFLYYWLNKLRKIQ